MGKQDKYEFLLRALDFGHKKCFQFITIIAISPFARSFPSLLFYPYVNKCTTLHRRFQCHLRSNYQGFHSYPSFPNCYNCIIFHINVQQYLFVRKIVQKDILPSILYSSQRPIHCNYLQYLTILGRND